MAFETFLTVDKQKPKKRRRLMFAVSLSAHAALLAVGVASSFASVEQLGPKNGTIVTFFNLPTPPPPPAGRKPKPKTERTKPITRPRPTNSIVSPPDHAPPETKDDDAGGNDPDGNPNGDPESGGGGGDGPRIQERPMVPPAIGKGYLAIDPQLPQYRPHLPPGFAGRSVSVLMRVCTDRDGNVIEVKVLRGFDPTIDAAFVAALRTWRYTPYKVDGRPVPFCTPVNYTLQTTN